MGSRRERCVFLALVAVATVMGCVAAWLVTEVAPTPEGTDLSQRIFYFHVPSAMAMYAGVAMCSLSSLVFLICGRDSWDAAGQVGAELAAVYCVVVLLTGPIWAAQAWGAPWVWDPRLTSVAVLGLILASYHMVRAVDVGGLASRRLAAVLGVLAAPNAVLIHVAVRMWGGQHPTVVYRQGGLDPTMLRILLFSAATAIVVFAVVAWLWLDLERARRRAAALEVKMLLGSSGENRTRA